MTRKYEKSTIMALFSYIYISNKYTIKIDYVVKSRVKNSNHLSDPRKQIYI